MGSNTSAQISAAIADASLEELKVALVAPSAEDRMKIVAALKATEITNQEDETINAKEEEETISVVATMANGDQRAIDGLRLDLSFEDLRAAAAMAFDLHNGIINLATAGGDILPAHSSDSLRALKLDDGAELIVIYTDVDEFDCDRCEEGNIIYDDHRNKRTLEKTGGADLTSTYGKAVVSSGGRRWNIKVDALGTMNPTNRSNVMIGVVHPDVPLDFVQNVWYRRAHVSDYDGQLFWVKSPGNTTEYWGTWDFGVGDVITVDVDVDAGTVSFLKNGVVMEREPCTGVQGPVSLFINLDYNGDAVSILSQ